MNTDMTLGEAKYRPEQNLDEGTKCLCCGRFNKRYRRKLNKGMARGLIRMYRRAGMDWIDPGHEFPKTGREEGKLIWWGLVEARPDGSRGLRVTPRGVAWLKGDIRVQSHAQVYQKQLYRLDGDLVDISWSLGEPFDYDELMSDRWS